MWHKYIANNVGRDIKLAMLTFVTAALKSFDSKFTAKIDFPYEAFYFTITDADMQSLKSLHTLFDKYLDHVRVEFDGNRILRNIEKLAFWRKMVNHFRESVGTILKDVSGTKAYSMPKY